jgi:hypothetical protein
MADNVAITAGVGTSVATDDVGGVHYQRVKLGLGADGAAADALGGAGAVATGVQRVTLASDDPAVTALQIMDDWDESNRAAVNTIAGQTGVAGGSGAVSALTQRVVLATDVGLPAGTAMLGNVTPEGTEYETVAASQTAQALGATGATGDYIAGVLIIPATNAPGNVLLLDNATSITIFTGGASSVSNLVPFFVPLGIKSVSGAWKITTGANVSCIGIGNFT